MRHQESEERASERGLTLLEVALYAAVLVAIGAPLVSAVLVSTRSTREVDTVNAITERNRTIVLRIEKEVRRAIGSTVSVEDLGKSLALTPPAGFDGASVVPGAPMRFELRPAPGESVNGVDDDGNGLVDEGELFQKDVATGAESLLARGIDLDASSFSRTSSGFTITLTNFGGGEGGTPFRISKTVTVYPRN